MSKKTPKTTRAPQQTWRDVSKTSTLCEGDPLVKRLTAQPVRAQVRPGMVVSIMGGKDDTAEVVAVLPDYCVAQGESGVAYALHWHEVDVVTCGPDPDYLPVLPIRTRRRPQRSSAAAATKQAKKASPGETFPRVAA